MPVDNKALAFAVALASLASCTLLQAMAKFRKEKGLTVYAAGMTSFMLGFLLLLGEGLLPAWFSLIFGNLLIAFCFAALPWGLRLRSHTRDAWPWRFWVYFAVWIAVFLPATIVYESYLVRSCLMSLTVIVFSGEFLVVLRERPKEIPVQVRNAAGAVAFMTGAMHAVRLGLLLSLSESTTKMLDDNAVSTFTLSVSLLSTVFWTGLILILDAARLLVQLETKNAQLNALAITDSLTGLGNRRSLESTLETEMERARRYRYPLSVISFDLDHFKRVNDTKGHAIGDEVLMMVSRAAIGLVREPDGVFRWGGEEFLGVAPNTHAVGAVAMAEKLRAAIARETHPRAGSVTASFGVAEWNPEEAKDAWLLRADQALYKAKADGRNRVVVSGQAGLHAASWIRMEWRSEWYSGNRIVDDGHLLLMDTANELLAASLGGHPDEKTAEIVDRLLAEIRQHFADEERELEVSGYPELAAHRRIHADLIEGAEQKREEFRAGKADPLSFFSFLVDKVIAGHLLTEDLRFFPYIRKTTDTQ